MNRQPTPFEAKDIMTPDSSEARMTLLLKPYSIVLILIIAFFITELLFGHVYIVTGDTDFYGGCEATMLPTGKVHYFEDEPWSPVGFVRPEVPLYYIIWHELCRNW